MCDKIDFDKPQDDLYATDDYSEVCEYTPPEPDYEDVPKDIVEQVAQMIIDARDNEERNEEGSVFTGRTESSDGGDDDDD